MVKFFRCPRRGLHMSSCLFSCWLRPSEGVSDGCVKAVLPLGRQDNGVERGTAIGKDDMIIAYDILLMSEHIG